MMISDLLNKIIDPNTEGSYSLVGTVIEVNESDRTCEVEPINGTAILYDVKLQANETRDKGFVIFPTKGSEVIVTLLNDKTGFVSVFSDFDKAEIVTGGQRLFFDAKGLKLSKQNADLREQLDKMFDLQSDILQLLTSFQLMTNVGVTTNVMPNIIVDLQKLKVKNEQIKTTIGQIIQ
jgi:hypothetical protein